IDAAVNQQPARALELLDDPRAGCRFPDRQRLAGEGARNERQHHAVGFGIEEYVLDELRGAQVLELRFPGARCAREAEEALAPLRLVLQPLPARIHEVPLHVEDEAAAPELRA